MPRKPKIKCPMPDSSDAWIREIAEGYVDAMGTIEYSRAIKQPMTEDAHLRLAVVTMLKARGGELTETNIQQATIRALSHYVLSEEDPEWLAIPQMAFAFCYIASHTGVGLLTEEQASELIDDITENLPQLIEKTGDDPSAAVKMLDLQGDESQEQAADILCKIIEQADSLRADSVSIEFDKDGGLNVTFLHWGVPIAVGHVQNGLDAEVMELIREEAGLDECVTGEFAVGCESHVLYIRVQGYNSSGETAYMLHMPKRRRGKHQT